MRPFLEMWSDPTWLSAVAQLEPVRAGKRRSYELLGLGPGRIVLDVGCGAGDDLRALSELVAPGGRAVGVDSSEELARLAGAVVADAAALPFAENTFDACRCDRTLQHVADPQAALAEMVRVTRPGGTVLISEMRHRLVGGELPDTRSSEDRERALSYGLMLPVFLQQAGLAQLHVEQVIGRLESADEIRTFCGSEHTGMLELETYLFCGKKPCTPPASAIQT